MPHLAIGEQNNDRNLAFHVVNDSGRLYDPAYISFHVEDADGAQVYPVSGDEEVTGEQAHVGVYYAKDVAMGTGIIPGTTWDAEEVEHYLVWTWIDADGNTRSWRQAFHVSPEGTGIGHWSYVSPNDVRAAGLSTARLPDADVGRWISATHQLIERLCRQPFRPVRNEFRMETPFPAKLMLPVPIIGIERIRMNNSSVDAPGADWMCQFNRVDMGDPGWLPNDNRRNPAIKLVADGSIYSRGGVDGLHGMISHFVEGHLNQLVTGVFGFLEPDGTTPRMIREAALELVLYNYNKITTSTVKPQSYGPVRRLRVDRHEQEWFAGAAVRNFALTASQEVEEKLALYRAPIIVAATGW